MSDSIANALVRACGLTTASANTLLQPLAANPAGSSINLLRRTSSSMAMG
jgi:hypothetical protein